MSMLSNTHSIIGLVCCSTSVNANNQTIKFITITKDEITMYVCCYALLLKEMLML